MSWVLSCLALAIAFRLCCLGAKITEGHGTHISVFLALFFEPLEHLDLHTHNSPFHSENMRTERHQSHKKGHERNTTGRLTDNKYQELTPFAMALPMDLDKAKPAPTGPQMADPEDRYASTSHCRSPCCFL